MKKCPICASEAPDDAKFCPGCGSKFIEPTLQFCPVCHAPVAPGARFCAQCGNPLQEISNGAAASPAETEALSRQVAQPGASISKDIPSAEQASYSGTYERRLVTILFTDVIGYSTISEHRDPEEVAEIMRGAYPAMLEPIQRNGGTVIQVSGDGALAFFGAPVAHEDDPERAIRAGLEISRAITQYADHLRKARDIPNFNVRVGIHTGLVVVGDMGQNRHLEYTAIGDAVNLAARLQQNAPPGGVLISHETYRHVRGLFVQQRQEPLSVKGREQSVQTYLVQSVKPQAWRLRTRGVEGVTTRLVGRDPELLSLQNTYHDSIEEGLAHFTLVVGDPGIGKSRLVDEFADWVDLYPQDVWFFRGQSTASSQAVPYSLLRDLFSYRFEILESDSAAQALQKFRLGMLEYLEPDQADLVGQLVGFDFSASPAVARLLGSPSFAQMATIYLLQYFRLVSAKPMLVLLEDLHWADESSLDLITQVIANLQGSGRSHLLIVGTARPVLYERRPNLGEGLPGFSRLNLAPLSRRASRELVLEILSHAQDAPDELVKRIVDEAEGSPFFIEELIKMLIDEAVIQTQSEPWQINMERLSELHVPPTLAGILQVRLDSLPLIERSVLQKAAVVGRVFWDLLISVLSAEPGESGEVSESLAKLRERELIFRRERSTIAGVGEYLFKHNLLRDVTYETVLLKQRRQYHAQIAAWIQANAGERLQEYQALIADHWRQAGNALAAADSFIRAGQRALNLGIMREARGLFDQALELLPDDQQERRWLALVGHDEVCGALGEREQRQADDQELLELARQTQDPARLSEAYRRNGFQAHTMGNDRQAIEFYDLSLAAARSAGRKDLEALALPLQVISYARLGEYDQAAALTRPTLELAESLGDLEIISRTLTNVCLYYTAVGDNARSAQLTRQVIEINTQQGNRIGELIGLTNLGYFYLLLGRYQDGQATLERALQLSRNLGMRRTMAYTLLNLALAHWRLEQSALALQALQEAAPEIQALGDQGGMAYYYLYLGLAQEQRGALDEACQAYTRASQSFMDLAMPAQMAEARAGQARLNLAQGNLDLARMHSDAAWEYLHNANGQGLELPILAYLACAQIYQTSGDFERAQLALSTARQILLDGAARISDPEWRTSYLENVPEHQQLLQDWPEAAQALDPKSAS